MLSQYMLQDIATMGRSERPHYSQHREIAHATCRGALEHGQKLYMFNRDKSGLEVMLFCGFVESIGGNQVAVISRGEGGHVNNMAVYASLTRDILLSLCQEYASEAVFVEEEAAKKALRRYTKAKAKAMLEKLEAEANG